MVNDSLGSFAEIQGCMLDTAATPAKPLQSHSLFAETRHDFTALTK